MSRPRLMSEGPAQSRVSLYGIPYNVDLEACRVRMVERVAELGQDKVQGDGRGGMTLVAEAAGVNYMTLRRFFEGNERMSVESFVAIITRGLKLDLNDVAKVEQAS